MSLSQCYYCLDILVTSCETYRLCELCLSAVRYGTGRGPFQSDEVQDVGFIRGQPTSSRDGIVATTSRHPQDCQAVDEDASLQLQLFQDRDGPSSPEVLQPPGRSYSLPALVTLYGTKLM